VRRHPAAHIEPALLLLALVGLWELGVRLFAVPAYILPPPSRVIIVFFLRFPTLWPHAVTTMSEILLGMLCGGLGGFALGAAIFYSPTLERALYPLIIGSQMIPVFAIAPLLVVWLGYGLWPKVAVAALIAFFPVTINTRDGLGAASPDHIDLFRSLGATGWQIFRKLRLPASTPALLSGGKVAVTLSVVGATIGEWIGARQGLGYLMLQSNAMLRVDMVFAAILALTLIGLLLFAAFRIIERRLLRWRTSTGNTRGGMQ
jgi:ABC-type nitrate/sulfonate/bicarbonate transport system permease component